MSKQNEIIDKLKQLLDKSYFGVLGTLLKDHPYLNLISVMPWKDYHSIVFATTKATRKYSNLKKNPKASIMIDNRSNSEEDISKGAAVSITGNCTEITVPSIREKLISDFLIRHPALAEFMKAPTTAIFELKIQTCYFVEHFQEVTEINMEDSK